MVGEHPLNVVVAALQISVVVILPMQLRNVEVAARDPFMVLVEVVICIHFGVVLFGV